MNIALKLAPLAILLLTTAPLAVPARAQTPAPAVPKAAPAASLPAWTPDPKLVSKLGPPQKFGPITMQLPKNFTVDKASGAVIDARTTQYQIFGPDNGPYSNTGMIIVDGTRLQPFTSTSSDDQLTLLVASYDLLHRTGGEAQYGTIHGLRFARQHFTHDDRFDPKHQTHAFAYTYAVDHTRIVIMAFDNYPYAPGGLALLQASVLTLHKTP